MSLVTADQNLHVINLPTGVLTVDVHESDMELHDLCGFAARHNPKRGFLFVSKVLGKHIPVKPSLMRNVHAQLASKIPADLPGPVLVIGMAETAIALGHGVHDMYVRHTGRSDVAFSHSTRYRLQQPVLLEFLEEHSHAADHIIYLPEDPDIQMMYANIRSLVLVDDEASTGRTFVNLAKAFKAKIPTLEHIVTAVITDWRGPTRTAETVAAMPVPSSTISVLAGEYQFTPAPNLVAMKMPKAVGDDSAKDHLLPYNAGRLGLDGPYQVPQVLFHRAVRKLGTKFEGKILVLGTGEFAYPPFALAEWLEAYGYDVHFQTTTRSPIMVGDAIGSALRFNDNYDDGIDNFVYNLAPGQYDRVLIVHETPTKTIDQTLIAVLNADTLEM